MNTLNRTTLYASLVTAAVVFGPELHATNWQTCNNGQERHWANGEITLRASGIGFPAGSVWRTALADVAQTFSATPADFEYSIQWDEPGVAMGNGQTEVWWTDTLPFPAAAYVWTNGACEFVEVDVLFLNTVSYTTSTTKTALTPYGGAFRPFHTTAMHEFGHAQGMAHTNDTYNIMGQDWDHIHCNGSTAAAYPGECAVDASMDIYGTVAGNFEDVAVAHWRHTGASGAYSTHDRTRLFTSGGVELSNVGGDEPVYLVERGQTVRLEMSYENLGKSFQTVAVEYVVSTNDTITTSDTSLAIGTVSIGVGTVATTSNTYLTIPNSLNGGQDYWLGAIIDHDNQLAEQSGSNNATYLGIRVVEDPDLEASGISGPADATVGDSMLVSRTIQSVGGPLPPGAFTYEVRLSSNATITGSDLLLTTVGSNSLGQVNVNVSIPDDLTPGPYYWGLRVLSVAGETDTSNNTVAGNVITIAGNPDLTAFFIEGPKKVKKGKDVTVEIGVDRSFYDGSYDFQIVLSEDDTIDVLDEAVANGSASTDGLQEFTFEMPKFPKGKYYWGLRVLSAPGEVSFSNNRIAGNAVKVKKKK